MLSRIREKVEVWFRGIAKTIVKTRFTPNMLTVSGLCLSIIAGFFYAYPISFWYFWVAATFLLLSGFCDILDGAVARISGRGSLLGNFLNSLTDRYADAAVLFGITFHFANQKIFSVSGYVWGLFAILGSILVSYTRAKAEGLSIRLEGIGLTERPERILILATTSIFLHPEIGLVVLAVLTNTTVIQRILYTLKQLRKGNNMGHS